MNTRVLTFLIVALSVVLLIGCTSKVVVKRIKPPEVGSSPTTANGSPTGPGPSRTVVHGVVYALPRTALEVKVPLIKTTYKKGTFCACTADLFPEEDFESKACSLSEAYHVETATISSKGEPDPKQIYFYEVAGGWMESRNAGFTFTEDLLLTDGEVESTNNTLDVGLKVLTTAATIASKVKLPDPPICADDQKVQAEKALEEINELKERRADLLLNFPRSGGDGTALSTALKEYDSQITSLKERYFFGAKKDKTVWTGSFEFRPDVSLPEVATLFDYAREKGLCAQNLSASASNRATYEGTEDSTCGNARRVTISFRRIQGQIADAIGSSDDDRGEYGFRYRVPAKYMLEVNSWEVDKDGVTKNPSQLARAEVPIAQLGVVVALPASTRSKRTKYTLALSPVTGAPKNFKLGTDALITKSTVEDVSGAVNTLLDARMKQVEEEKKQKDELAQLQRKRQILEEELKIKEAEEKLKPK